jgi:hypothetical protein
MNTRGEGPGTRVRDPIGGPPNLERFFTAYERHFRSLDSYEFHVLRVLAGYSRGDSRDELLEAFSFAVRKLTIADERSRSADGEEHRILRDRGAYVGVFREALVFLGFGLCLRAPRDEIDAILRCCDRGDPLLEAFARVAAPGTEAPAGRPVFYDRYDGLYDALNAPEAERVEHVRWYLDVWYSVKMADLPFTHHHLLTDQPDYVGYWCIEAAGVVAALGIPDASFAEHPHYPKDLVAFYRRAQSP